LISLLSISYSILSHIGGCLLSIGIIGLVLNGINIIYYNITNKKKNEHVVITGGSQGIGLSLAKHYLILGNKVTIIARNQNRLDEAVKYLSNFSNISNILAISADVSSFDDINKAIEKTINHFGKIDVLVNCAGTSVAGAFDQLDLKSFEYLMNVS